NLETLGADQDHRPLEGLRLLLRGQYSLPFTHDPVAIIGAHSAREQYQIERGGILIEAGFGEKLFPDRACRCNAIDHYRDAFRSRCSSSEGSVDGIEHERVV